MILENSLQDLTDLLSFGSPGGNAAAPSNNFNQIYYNNRFTLLANQRPQISALYNTNGLVQKFIDMPVDDAFRDPVKIKSQQLGEDKIKKLLQYMDEHAIMEKIGMAKKWGRLYGGGGLAVNCGQDTSRPFNINSIKSNTPLRFIPVDLWELAKFDENLPSLWSEDKTQIPYNYYGVPLHRSRVLIVRGKEPTSWDRPRLRNWGMSELERILQDLNSHMRARDLVFELLSQFKLDVWKIKDYNDNLADDDGTTKVNKRISHSNVSKNYLNAVIMDTEDDFIQKQISINGIPELLNEICKGLACVLNIPMTKLFGISASGFSSGDEDMENYNTMVEHEIRAKSKYLIIDVLKIICMKLFGFVPSDLEISFKSLRMLNAEQEESIKVSQLSRISSLFSSGLMTSQEAIISINKDHLVGIEISEKDIKPMEQKTLESNGKSDIMNKGGLKPKMTE